MNRAMGFGILSGTMTGTMLASTAVVPTPASAHPVSISGPFGQISIDTNHTVMVIEDFRCNDGFGINGQIKYTDGRLLPTLAEDCDPGHQPEPIPSVTRHGFILENAYAVRKCATQGGGSACDDQGWYAL